MKHSTMQGQDRTHESLGASIAWAVPLGGLWLVVEAPSLDGVWWSMASGASLGLVAGVAAEVALWGLVRLGARRTGTVRGNLAATLVFVTVAWAIRGLIWDVLTRQSRFVNDLSMPIALALGIGLSVVLQVPLTRWAPRWCASTTTFAMLATASSLGTFYAIVAPYAPFHLAVGAWGVLLLASVACALASPTRTFGLAAAAALSVGVLCTGWMATQTQLPANASLKFLERPAHRGTLALLQGISDLDGDGYSHLFAGGDCSPWEPTIHPWAVETAGNGVDDNCAGGDVEALVQQPFTASRSIAISHDHIFLVTIDTLRFDAVGATVDGQAVTPNLSAFAAQSMVYQRAYAPSTHTNESVPSMMSGEYPPRWHHRTTYMGQESTMAQRFGDAGYFTFATLALPWLHDGAILGFDFVDNEYGRTQLHGTENGEKVLKRFFDRLDTRPKDRRAFGWLHLLEPHAPYLAGGPEGGDLSAGYLRDVRASDAVFGAFISGLSARGLLERSIIVVASDHGEGLGEHGVATHVWGTWESIIRVPLLLSVPGQPASARNPDCPGGVAAHAGQRQPSARAMGRASRRDCGLLGASRGQAVAPCFHRWSAQDDLGSIRERLGSV